MIEVKREQLPEVFLTSARRITEYNNFSSKPKASLAQLLNNKFQEVNATFDRFIEKLPEITNCSDIDVACQQHYEKIFGGLQQEIEQEIPNDFEKFRKYFRTNVSLLLREIFTSFRLRPYQYESLANIQFGLEKDKKTFLIQLPTGTGKTIDFAFLPEFFNHNKKVLILAHRDQLLKQAAGKMKMINPELKICLVSGKVKELDPDADVVIASVPALGREDSKKLTWLNPQDFSLIVTDEAHHALADTYVRIYDYFRKGTEAVAGNSEIVHVGFTATPIRGDKKDLKKIFPELTYSMSLKMAIDQEWLSRIIGFRINTNTDLSNVRTGINDLNISELEEAVNTPQRNKKVVEAWQKHALGKKILIFAVDIQHSKDLCNEFIEAEVRAVHVDGNTPGTDLDAYIEQLETGEIEVIVNCNLLTEGFDCPGLEAVIMARPTESALLYEQMIGRGTRKILGIKEKMILIDIVDNTQRHKLIDAAKLFGIMGKEKEGDLVSLVDKEELEQEEEQKRRIRRMKTKKGFAESERLDFFAEYEEIKNSSVHFVGRHGSFRVFIYDKVVHLGMDVLGNWTLVLPDGQRDSYEDLQGAIDLIESWLIDNCWDQKHFWHKNHIGWMQDPATEKQLQFLEGIKWFIDQKYSEFWELVLNEEITKKDAAMILGDYSQTRKDRKPETERIATEKQLQFLRNRLKTLTRVKVSFTLEGLMVAEASKAIEYCKQYDIPTDKKFRQASPLQVDLLCNFYPKKKRVCFEQLPVQEAQRLIDLYRKRSS